jgi:hypothetical protein
MTEHRTLGTATRMAADRENSFIVGPRGPVLVEGFEHLDGPARRERGPRLTVVSGSADYSARSARPITIDVTDYREIKAPAQTAKRTDPFVGSVVSALLSFAAAAVMVAIAFSVTLAPDALAPVAGPLSGHGILHFPR